MAKTYHCRLAMLFLSLELIVDTAVAVQWLRGWLPPNPSGFEIRRGIISCSNYRRKDRVAKSGKERIGSGAANADSLWVLCGVFVGTVGYHSQAVSYSGWQSISSTYRKPDRIATYIENRDHLINATCSIWCTLRLMNRRAQHDCIANPSIKTRRIYLSACGFDGYMSKFTCILRP